MNKILDLETQLQAQICPDLYHYISFPFAVFSCDQHSLKQVCKSPFSVGKKRNLQLPHGSGILDPTSPAPLEKFGEVSLCHTVSIYKVY